MFSISFFISSHSSLPLLISNFMALWLEKIALCGALLFRSMEPLFVALYVVSTGECSGYT